MSTEPSSQPKTPGQFSRPELWTLHTRALDQIHPDLNPGWARAYQRLADAADVLDAFFARSSVCPTCHPVSPPDDCKQEPSPVAGAVE